MAQSVTTQTSTTTVGNFATVAASNLHNKHTRKLKKKHDGSFNTLFSLILRLHYKLRINFS